MITLGPLAKQECPAPALQHRIVLGFYFFLTFFFYLTISKVNKTRAFWIVFQVELKFFCDVRKESEAGRCERSRMKSQNHRINLALGKFLTLTFLVTTGALQ